MLKMASEEEMMRQMMGFSGFGNSFTIIFSICQKKNMHTIPFASHLIEKISIWRNNSNM